MIISVAIVVINVLLGVLICFFINDYETQVTIASIHANFWGIILGLSPLSTVRSVLRSRNSSSIDGKLTLTLILNSALWTGEGFSNKNVIVIY